MSIEPAHDFVANAAGTSVPALFGPSVESRETAYASIFNKWGDAARAGFQAVPDLLFKHQTGLQLSPTDMVVLLNILMHWWYSEQKPFPRPTTIAARMGVTVRTVQRSISRLEELGLLKKGKNEKGSVIYDPDPLADKLSTLAKGDKDFLIRTTGQKAA